jgi:hypothetical protein
MFIQRKNRVSNGLKNCTSIITFKLGESFFFVSVYLVKKFLSSFVFNTFKSLDILCEKSLDILCEVLWSSRIFKNGAKPWWVSLY